MTKMTRMKSKITTTTSKIMLVFLIAVTFMKSISGQNHNSQVRFKPSANAVMKVVSLLS